MAMRFKEVTKKFSGALGECWNEYIYEYNDACRDHNLTNDQKLRYLHHLLTGNAKRYFSREVKDVAKDYAQALKALDAEYNSISCQNRISAYRCSIHVSQYVTPVVQCTVPGTTVHRTVKICV